MKSVHDSHEALHKGTREGLSHRPFTLLPPPQAVYTALKETETRATDVVPYWKLPGADRVVPRLIKAAAAVQLIRDTTEMLVAKCRVCTPPGRRAFNLHNPQFK